MVSNITNITNIKCTCPVHLLWDGCKCGYLKQSIPIIDENKINKAKERLNPTLMSIEEIKSIQGTSRWPNLYCDNSLYHPGPYVLASLSIHGNHTRTFTLVNRINGMTYRCVDAVCDKKMWSFEP